MIQVALIMNSLTYLGFGILALFWPQTLANMVEIEALSATGFGDIRATYGGCMTALGLFFFYARTKWQQPALVLATFCVIGFLSGRLISILLDGPPSKTLIIALLIEGFILILNLIALKKTRLELKKPTD